MLCKNSIKPEGTNNADSRLDLAVIVPTFNERESLPELVERLKNTLDGLNWELIIVDDDSPDGTAKTVRELAVNDHRIRIIHRIGRRGLSSACIAGMMATESACIAVMDADLQHDESLLPLMLKKLRLETLDLVVGTRNADGGSMGSFSSARVFLSRLGQHIGYAMVRCPLSDPMSGFFLLRRELFSEVVHRLSGKGFKLLLDIVTSNKRPLKVGEVGYTFRNRRFGKSKINTRVGFEFLAMILKKRIDDLLDACLVDSFNQADGRVDQLSNHGWSSSE
jgi:dolichol-phosphate mannosyltransferase